MIAVSAGEVDITLETDDEGIELNVVAGMGSPDEAVDVEVVVRPGSELIACVLEPAVEVVILVTPGIAGVDADIEAGPGERQIDGSRLDRGRGQVRSECRR